VIHCTRRAKLSLLLAISLIVSSGVSLNLIRKRRALASSKNCSRSDVAAVRSEPTLFGLAHTCGFNSKRIRPLTKAKPLNDRLSAR